MFGQTQQVNSDFSGLVGGQQPSGAGKALQLDNSGNLLTSATVTPAANQRVNAQAGDFVAGSIVDLATLLLRIATLGQKTMAGSEPVVIASDQSNVPISGTITANAGTNLNTSLLALESGGNLAAILADTADIETNTGNIPPLGQATMAASTPVAIASNQTTVPISGTVTTTPPSNASTNLTQIGGAALSEGQQTMANSIPVVLASNQSNVSTTIATALPAGSNIIGLVEQSDGTNVSNVLKGDMTAAGQNAELIAPAYFSTGTLTLNAGSPNTVWYDLGNYPWISLEILTNTTPATLTFQTSGDNAQTNVRSMTLADSQATSGSPSTTTTSANATFVGPRTGRYFRVSSNVAGGNTVTLVITFYTAASSPLLMGTTFSALTGIGSAAPGTAMLNGVSDGSNLQALRTPNVFKGITATASGDTALWTPAAGKKFRLMGFILQLTADASAALASDFDIILRDGTTALAFALSAFVPTVAATTFGNTVSTGWIMLGNGYLSNAANNVLNINLSSTLTNGKARAIAIGTEE